MRATVMHAAGDVRIETITDADHVIHLHDGRVVAEGSAATVLARINRAARS